MSQEQETKKGFDREEFLKRRYEGKIDYSRYIKMVSESDSTKYHPKELRVLSIDDNKTKLEIIIDERENFFSIRTSDNYKISGVTLDYIKKLFAKYYTDSKYVDLFYNGNYIENINAIISELESNVTDISDNYESIPDSLNPSYNRDVLEYEMNLYIDKEAKKAYVIMPRYDDSIQEKMDKFAKDIIEKIGEDCEIYLINSTGEAYKTITIDQMLGKERIENFYGYDVHLIAPEKRINSKYPIISINQQTKKMYVELVKDMKPSEYTEVIKNIENLRQNCNTFRINIQDSDDNPIFEGYFEDGYKKVIEKIENMQKEEHKSETKEEPKSKTNEISSNDDYVQNWDSYINTVKGNRQYERGFDYNRYFSVNSTFDSENYEPKRFIITDPSTKTKKLEMIVNEENLSIEIKTYNNTKISAESVRKIESIMSLFFTDTWATNLIFNGKSYLRKEQYDEFMSLIESKVEPGVKDEYQMMSQGENVSDFETAIDNEIHLHIFQDNAYVKLPRNIKGAKEKLVEIGNTIRNILGDNHKIYAINSAGEIYAPLTLNQLLGKEEISEDIAKHGFAGLKEFKTPDTIHIQTDEMNKQFSIAISADATALDYKELLNFLKENSGVYAIYNRILLFEEKENGDIHQKTGYLQEGRKEILKEIERLRDEKLKKEHQENPHVDQNNEEEFEELVNTEILNTQNMIIIEKNSDRVDKYIYDSKTKEKVHEFTLEYDKYNMYTSGTYVNIVEYATNVLTNIANRYENLETLTFITEDQEELTPAETMKRAYAYCSTGGGMSVGDEYVDLFRNKGKNVQYEDLEEMYSGTDTKSYNKGKTKLEKGLYMNKELIEKFFKTLKVRIKVNENQDTTGVGQMGR